MAKSTLPHAEMEVLACLHRLGQATAAQLRGGAVMEVQTLRARNNKDGARSAWALFAFTLMELLVVIAIIAVLAGLLEEESVPILGQRLELFACARKGPRHGLDSALAPPGGSSDMSVGY